MSIEYLLKAILDDPHDVSCRLVYADALQDRGDPRGEFIAHHIAGRPEAEALLKRHGKEWIGHVRFPLPEPTNSACKRMVNSSRS